ncbi:MAG: hypothetical protein NTU98_09055 [Bacteroidetes bacterium]|nr:hypothetical protein [Bacteroidota bacterium]
MSFLPNRIKTVFLSVLIYLPLFLSAQFIFKTNDLAVTVSPKGSVISLYDRVHEKEYIAAGQVSPLVQIKVSGQLESPSEAAFKAESGDPASGIILLSYHNSKISLKIRTHQTSTHVRFEVAEVRPAGKVDLIVWGPYPLVLNETVGEIIGVVRNQQFAVGLQVLNVKTLGGYPLNDEGSDPSRSNTAKKTEFGSMLQAFSMDRSRPRQINVWWDQFPDMPVPPVKGETVAGSAIAVFGCAADKTLLTIGRIEVEEKLPHPMIDGIWGKVSPQSGRSYLIADYSDSTIDELLGYTQRANLMTLYHMNGWKSWGHYEPDTAFFHDGAVSFKRCRMKAKAMNIRLGAHTLTDFINTNDPYVTPVPDPRLAVTGFSRLLQEISDTVTVIRVESPEYFNNEKANWLHTVRIDEELIQYTSVTSDLPYTLTGCTRGAFGTKAFFHRKGAKVAKLMDHPYKVFLPNLELQQEIAVNLAHRFNEMGLEQMDFDGHEGCLSSGQGDYALELFAKTFYDHLDHTVLNGTSNSEPFYWHINTYCNWGEPWNGGFTESMQQYRLDNQGLFERNYLPHMLGWYLLTEKTTLPEMEWMLARSAGYNAGFAMVSSLESLRKNPYTGELLDAIREWEICRRENVFPPEVKEQLKDPKKEFHLEKVSETSYDLFPVYRDAESVSYKRGEAVRVIMRR